MRTNPRRLVLAALVACFSFAAIAACSGTSSTVTFPDGGEQRPDGGTVDVPELDATLAVTCSAGEILCGAACVDTSRDLANCGACGRACKKGEACTEGTCALACGGGTTVCGGACADTNVDPGNCGACGKACAPGLVCSGGACGLTCAPAYATCGGGDGGRAFCASTATDNAHCGSCNVACGTGQDCVKGACVITCSAGLTPCAPDGGVPVLDAGASCVDVTTDNANCGTCGTTCAMGTSCVSGSCQLVCRMGATVCTPDAGADAAQYCAFTPTDNANCGSCGNACGDSGTCQNGLCAKCPGLQTVCSGACVDTSSDPLNCKVCGGACGMGAPTCCSATCTNTQTTDVLNCGFCGNACAFYKATAICSSGTCSLGGCLQGFADCNSFIGDGCETNITTGMNCGMCGRSCDSGVCGDGGVCN